MLDEFDPDRLKPQNVSEAAAESFLLAAGWVRQKDKWLAPVTHVAFTRGQAVVQQFRKDFVRLVFIIQHLPPEFLELFIPPVVFDKMKEIADKTLADQLEKHASKTPN